MGGRTYPNGSSNPNGQNTPPMNYPPELLHNMLSSMSSLGGLLGGGLGVPQLQGLGGLGGLNIGGLVGNPNLGNPGLTGSSLGGVMGGGLNGLGGQGFGTQGLGMPGALGSMIPNLQALQTLQTLQSLGKIYINLGGLMNPSSLGLQGANSGMNPNGIN